MSFCPVPFRSLPAALAERPWVRDPLAPRDKAFNTVEASLASVRTTLTLAAKAPERAL